jgi:hypothetical protein
MIVDCMSCPVRGIRCDDCVVSVLLSAAELPLDAAERQAVSVLVGAGLVGAESVAGLTARREPWGRVSAVG